MLKSLTLSLTAACLAAPLGAQVLMLDFGPTTAIDEAGTPNSQLNSPYHSENNSFAGTNWNKLGNSDPAFTLKDANGDDTGITFNLGLAASGATTVDLGSAPNTSGALGGQFGSSGTIYSETSVGRDGIYHGSSGNKHAVGFQVGGLAGTYEVYIVARNTSTSNTYEQNIHWGVGASSGNFSYTSVGYTTDTLNYAGVADASAWTEGVNYSKFTVTLADGQFLNVAVVGGATTESRGFLNAVQIVAIPEPASAALLAGTGLLALAGSRRRRTVSA